MCKSSIKLYKNFEMFSVPCLNIYRDEGGPNQTKGARGQKKNVKRGSNQKYLKPHKNKICSKSQTKF